MYYLQHERPCCIGRYKLEPKARVCTSDTTRTHECCILGPISRKKHENF